MSKGTISAEDEALLTTFGQMYRYAPNMQQATEYMSTADIYNQLKESRGNLSFTLTDLDDWLTKQKYATTMVEMKRLWLFLKD